MKKCLETRLKQEPMEQGYGLPIEVRNQNQIIKNTYTKAWRLMFWRKSVKVRLDEPSGNILNKE